MHSSFRLMSLFIVLIACGLSSAETRPNVLLIAIDDLNDWVGCLGGSDQAQTPHIDRLAARGTLFANAHCQAPLCGPSRASFLSGLYPNTTGVYQQPCKPGLQVDHQNFREQLMPAYFASQGYKTLAVGKIVHGYPPEMAFHQYGGQFVGFGPKPGNETVRFNYTPDWSLPFSGTQTDWGAYPERDKQLSDHQAANWAIEQLQVEHRQPFMLCVGFVRPHVPLYVPQKWFDQFPIDQVQIPEVPDDDLNDVPEISRQVHAMPRFPSLGWLRESDNQQFRKCVQGYLASCAFVDHQVGRVIDALDASGYADDTVIVLLSDHGYHLGEKHRVCKHGLWEEATRVPLIVVPAKTHRGAGKILKRCDRPVGLIDVFPTMLELCGLPRREKNQGHSLVGLTKSADADWRFAILTTYGKNNHALRSERFRFIRYENGAEELYDHQTDPEEWDNIAAKDAYSKHLQLFRSLLPKNNAPYHPMTKREPVNAWFAEQYRREGVTN